MGILSGIKNFIKTKVLGIDDNNTEVKAADKKSKPNAVIECKTEAPEDKVTVSKDNKVKPAQQAKGMSHKALEQSIENIPSKTFNIRKMLKNGLIEKITGLSKEEFEKLTSAQKNLVITAVRTSIAKFEQMMAEGKINKSANPEELISAFAEILYSAINSGDFKNAEEFQNEMGDVAAELGEDFDKKPAEEQRKRLKANRVRDDKKLQEELDAIKDLPEEERIAAEKRIRRRHQSLRRGRFVDVNAQYSSQTAANAMIITNSEDMPFAAKTLLNTRCDDAEKTETANYVSYDFTKNLIKDYKEMGDEVKADALKEYTQTFMMHKSADAANEYQEAYKTDRDKFEAALQKQRRGEALTAEEEALLALMSPDYYTATAQGIGQGALNNVNMTADEKSAFIAKWENDAKAYSDYKEVTQNVKNEIKNNPEYKEIKTKLDEIQQKNDTEATTPSQVSIVNTNKNSQVYNTERGKDAEPVEKQVKDNSMVSSITSAKKLNVTVITKEIKEQGLSETVKKYGSDAVAIILDNPSLKHLKSKLTPIIKSYDLTTLKKLTQECSDDAFVYICSIVNEDYIEKLKENREHTKGLCYNAGKEVENLKGEYAAA